MRLLYKKIYAVLIIAILLSSLGVWYYIHSNENKRRYMTADEFVSYFYNREYLDFSDSEIGMKFWIKDRVKSLKVIEVPEIKRDVQIPEWIMHSFGGYSMFLDHPNNTMLKLISSLMDYDHKINITIVSFEDGMDLYFYGNRSGDFVPGKVNVFSQEVKKFYWEEDYIYLWGRFNPFKVREIENNSINTVDDMYYGFLYEATLNLYILTSNFSPVKMNVTISNNDVILRVKEIDYSLFPEVLTINGWERRLPRYSDILYHDGKYNSGLWPSINLKYVKLSDGRTFDIVEIKDEPSVMSVGDEICFKMYGVNNSNYSIMYLNDLIQKGDIDNYTNEETRMIFIYYADPDDITWWPLVYLLIKPI